MDDAERMLGEVSAMFADLAVGLPDADPNGVLDAIARVAVARVRGVSSAGVTVLEGTRFATRAGTDELAQDADSLQYELGAGPALDAARDGAVGRIDDALGEARWPGLGRRLAEHGFLSALSLPLVVRTGDAGVAAALNLYSEPAHAFDQASVLTATLLATHGGLAYARAGEAARAANLERALDTNQTIGPAIGLIMAQHKVSHDQAMAMLRKISQRINRKVSDLAAEVVEAGTLRQPVGPMPCSGG